MKPSPHLKKIEEPLVLFSLKAYEDLMEYMEDIEDKLSVLSRKEESEISEKDVEAAFNKKFINLL